MTNFSTQNIELLHITACHYKKGQLARHYLPMEAGKFHFWASGDTFFNDPRLFVDTTVENRWIPKVNLTHFECRASTHNVMGVSLLEIEMEHRWASDCVAHDLPVFMAAFKRYQTSPARDFSADFAQFTLVYLVEQFVTRNDYGKDGMTEITCLGELDYARITDICLPPKTLGTKHA